MTHVKQASTPRARAVDVFSILPPARPSLAFATAGINGTPSLPAGGNGRVVPAAHTAGVLKIKAADIVAFGAEDTLPVLVAEAIAASGTATTCRNRLTKFISADGFTDKAAAIRKVNSHGQTADALLAEIASYCASYLSPAGGAFALRVKYAADGTVGEAYNVPLGWVRKLKDGRFLVHRGLGTKKFKLPEAEVLDAYDADPAKVNAILAIADSVNPETGQPYGQPGQLLYVHTRAEGQEDYPVPAWWAGVNDVYTDTEIAAFDLDQVRGGFFPTAILTMLGELNNTEKDERGKTDEDRLADKLRAFTGKGRNPLEGRQSLLVLQAPTKDLAPALSSIDTTAVLKVLDTKREAIGRAVCRHFGVIPALAGFAIAGQLGNAQEMANSVRLMQSDVVSGQGAIQRTFEMLWPDTLWPISTLSLFGLLPPEVWAVLTPDEKRAQAGFAPLATPVTPAA